MALTATDKAAGRAFRDARNAALAAMAPAAPCSPYVREYRHLCPARGGASAPVRLREHREDAGPFAFIWAEGRCAPCGLSVRSGAGRLVLAAGLPPAAGRRTGGG